MKKILFAFGLILMSIGCKQPPTFDKAIFLKTALQEQMMDEQEMAFVELNLEGVVKPSIRVVAAFAKKANYKTISEELQLNAVNVDSSFSFVKYFREQLVIKTQHPTSTPIVLKNNDVVKQHAVKLLKALYTKNFITASQYAKIMEQIQSEPVLFPFVVFEWLETMP